jgi:outer membrane protein insertion porin family
MVLDLAKDLPVSLSSVHVTGAPNTRTSFLDAVIRPYLDRGDLSEGTLQDVFMKTSLISQALLKTDAFSVVLPSLRRSESIYASEQDVELHIKLKEKSRFASPF